MLKCRKKARLQEEDPRRKSEEEARQQAERDQEFQDAMDDLMGLRDQSRTRARLWKCWKVLGLQPTATVDEVKARYRELVMQHHPDRYGDPEEFKRVQNAYNKVMDQMSPTAH